MGPNYIQQTLGTLGYSAQEIRRGTDPEKVVKHMKSELNRLRIRSDMGKLFMDYDLPKDIFEYESIPST